MKWGRGKEQRSCGFFEHRAHNLGMFSSMFCLNPHQAALNARSTWIIRGPFLFVLPQRRQSSSNICFKWMPDQAGTQRNAWRISVSLSVLCLKQRFSPSTHICCWGLLHNPQSGPCNSRNHVVWWILTFANLQIAECFGLNRVKVKYSVWNSLPTVFGSPPPALSFNYLQN